MKNIRFVENREVDMAKNDHSEAIEKGMRTLWIIWGGMFLTLFIYVLVCHLLVAEFRGGASLDFPLGKLRRILYVVAAATLLITYLLRKSLLRIRQDHSGSRTPESRPVLNQPPFLAKYTTAMLILCALCEAIGIYGFVLFLIGDTFQTLYVFICVSALAMYFYRPKREELKRMALAMGDIGLWNQNDEE